MTIAAGLKALPANPVAGNLACRTGSLLALAASTLIVARVGGPALVGNLALLRLLPWLVGVVLSVGLPTAVPYFLAGSSRDDPRLPRTLAAITLAAGIAGSAVWVTGAPLLRMLFFHDFSIGLVRLAGLMVVTSIPVVVAKACGQSIDQRVGNLAFVLDDALFLPAYVALLAVGADSHLTLILAPMAADVTTGTIAWTRLRRRGFFAPRGRPSWALARRILWFGARGQIGNLMNLANLRLDFLLVGTLTGSAMLGTYAVASKYAELLRLVPTALNWVLYPRYARTGAQGASEQARAMLPRAALLSAVLAAPLALAAPVVLPLLYGEAFRASIIPTEILIAGLVGDGMAQVASAFLLAVGRPGLNSTSMGVGLVTTAALDYLLIPSRGAVGAAIASTVAYISTAGLLIIACGLVAGRLRRGRVAVIPGISVVPPRLSRRLLDLTVSGIALILVLPVLAILCPLVRRSTGGSAIYKQERVGQGGMSFTIYKLRSMACSAGGPEITAPDDPRVTRLGAFLRATSLDELPQLFNVLRGDMTLVGPRPETVDLARRYPAEYEHIFAYRPGLTGPVQLLQRDEVPEGLQDAEGYYLECLVPRRVAADLNFLVTPTLGHTLWVLQATAGHVLKRAFSGASPRALRAPTEQAS